MIGPSNYKKKEETNMKNDNNFNQGVTPNIDRQQTFKISLYNNYYGIFSSINLGNKRNSSPKINVIIEILIFYANKVQSQQ